MGVSGCSWATLRIEMAKLLPKNTGADLAQVQVPVKTHNRQKAPRFIARYLALGCGTISMVAIASLFRGTHHLGNRE